MKKVGLVVAAFAAAGAVPALADVRIAVQLDTQPVLTPSALVFPDNTPVAISLADLLAFTGSPSGPFRLTVWVFDDGMFQGQQSVPTTRLPALTITASPADTLPEQLDILAVGPSIVGTAVTFPAMPLTFDENLTGDVGLVGVGSFCALEYQLVTAPLTIRSVVNLGTGPLTRDTLTPQPVYFRVGCTVGGNPNPADIVSIGGDPVPDGLVTGDDFNAFIAAFGAQDLLADITGVGGPPALPDSLLTGDDFIAFINAFAQGCDD